VQRYLDPADADVVGLCPRPGPMSPHVRAFGRYPDVSAMRPGDLVLVSAVEPTWLSRRIMAAQEQGGFAADDARWHHAAVYVGNGRICEATLRGVQACDLDQYVGTHRIRVRRDPQLRAMQGYDIAMHALFRMRWYYSLWTLVRLLLQSWRGFHADPVALPLSSSRAVICSMLYADAYSLVTQRVLGNAAGATPTPAFLSATPILDDVVCGWRALEGGSP
jgi:cell wall-associated NlpC family hydrolase